MPRTKWQPDRGTILWVEDDYYHLRGLARPLVRMGFEIVPARSFVEAHGLLKDWQRFRLIILDLIIPYSESEVAGPEPGEGETDEDLAENGRALFNHISEELHATVPVILLSVVKTRTLIDDLLRRGAAARVEKHGLLPKHVTQVVLELLGGPCADPADPCQRGGDTHHGREG